MQMMWGNHLWQTHCEAALWSRGETYCELVIGYDVR
jgi:hypothetical protein